MAPEETDKQANCYTIHITLISDATFGRGDGVAGLVNQEIEHDSLGLPFLRGRTLKGLLNEECANILFALSRQHKDTSGVMRQWHGSAQRLFGRSGSGVGDAAWVHYSNAQLPLPIRDAVAYGLENSDGRTPGLEADDIIQSLTAIRRQTALDEMGVPINTTLRSMRVVLRNTPFESEVAFQHSVEQNNLIEQDLALLAACVKAWQRAGTGRNRGRGRLAAALYDNAGIDITDKCFGQFKTLTSGVDSEATPMREPAAQGEGGIA